MRNSKSQLFNYGECDKDWRPGSGRHWKQALLNQPVGHVLALRPSEETPDRLSLGAGEHIANHKQTNFTGFNLPHMNPCQIKIKGLDVSGYAI